MSSLSKHILCSYALTFSDLTFASFYYSQNRKYGTYQIWHHLFINLHIFKTVLLYLCWNFVLNWIYGWNMILMVLTPEKLRDGDIYPFISTNFQKIIFQLLQRRISELCKGLNKMIIFVCIYWRQSINRLYPVHARGFTSSKNNYFIHFSDAITPCGAVFHWYTT